jgi:hypothetical protein
VTRAMVASQVQAGRLLVERFVSRPRRSDYANPRLASAAREQLLACGRRALVAPIAAADPRRESAAESLSAGHFLLAGVPAPDLQRKLVTAQGAYYPDFFWSGPGVIGEVDGAVKYQTAEAFVQEKQREQVLRDLGFTVVRWLAREVMLRGWPSPVPGHSIEVLVIRAGITPHNLHFDGMTCSARNEGADNLHFDGVTPPGPPTLHSWRERGPVVSELSFRRPSGSWVPRRLWTTDGPSPVWASGTYGRSSATPAERC